MKFYGNVSTNLGQAPAKQSAIMAGLKDTVPCTTINKVCSSGMKSIMIGLNQLLLVMKLLVEWKICLMYLII